MGFNSGFKGLNCIDEPIQSIEGRKYFSRKLHVGQPRHTVRCRKAVGAYLPQYTL